MIIPPIPFLVGLLCRKSKTIPCNSAYSVIVPVHNKRNNIQETLESIFNQTRTPNHVVVIDDHSDDGSTKVIEDLKYKLTLLKFEKNVGKANAINEGLKYVEDPFVLILDADTILAKDYCELVLQGFVKDVVGVSGRVLSSSGKSQYQKSRTMEYLYGQRLMKTVQVAIGGMWVLMGCASMWNTKWLKDSGGMPSNTVVEDLELTWRAQLTNKLNYIHNAICYTEDPSSLRAYISQIYRWYSWRPAFGFVDFMKLRKELKIVMAWSLFDIISAITVVSVIVYSLLTSRFDFVVQVTFISWMMYTSIAGYEGYKVGKFWDAIEGVPSYLVLWYINILVLIVALIHPKKRWY